ncbi:MAG: zinc metalloprotease HtpX [Mariprofundus sp.]|nr:zinc metalloprotease HtpX [Mariprofundus sp.]
MHQSNKLRNSLHTALLLGGMLLLLLALSTSLFGSDALLLMLITCGMLLLFTPRASAWLTLRLHHARPLPFDSAPELYRIVQELARRAELSQYPLLFYIPSATPNAFAMQEQGQPLIAVTDGLLNSLNEDEITAVLAHEISHIRNGDLYVMMAADMITRLTSSLATAGWLILVIFLPVWLLTGAAMPWLALLLLLLAPLASTLLQLALSRTREFDADLDAARITKNPAALARALLKLEQSNNRWWNWLIPIRHNTGSSWARTHPPTQERVRRLHSLATEQQQLRINQAGFYKPWHTIATPPLWHNRSSWY